MGSLSNILSAVVVVWSIVSVIVYILRNTDSRDALKDLAKEKPFRQATDLELEAAFSSYKLRPVSNEVRVIRGAWRRHGISSQGANKWHDLIGDIEVMPFPGWDALMLENNTAEIVAGPKDVGLILSFNEMSLSDALAQKLRTARLESELKSDEDVIEDAPASASTHDAHLEIYSRREETASEASARARHASDGLLWIALLWAGLAALLFAACAPDEMRLLAIPAVGLAAFSVWRLYVTLNQVPPGNAAQLRSLRGPLSFGEKTSGFAEAVHKKVQTYVGELAVEYPEHWKSAVVASGAGPVDVDVDLQHKVLRHGRLSLYEEWTRFPVTRWGWHAGGMIGAGVVAAIAFGMAYPLGDSLGVAWLRLQGDTRDLRADTPSQLMKQQPKPGDRLLLTGFAQCLKRDGRFSSDLKAIEELNSETAPSCEALGWNASPVPLKSPEVDQALTALDELDSSIARSAVRYRIYDQDDSSLGATLGELAIVSIGDLNDVVQEVEHVCAGLDANTNCDSMRTNLTQSADEDGQSWQNVLEKAKERKLKTIANLSEGASLVVRDDLKAIVSSAEHRAALQAVRLAGESQPPGLIVDIIEPNEGLTLSNASAQNSFAAAHSGGEAPPVGSAADADSSAAARLDFPYVDSGQALLNNRFALQGELVSITQDARGTKHLRLRGKAQFASTMSVVSPLIALLLAILAIGAHVLGLRRALAVRAAHNEAVAAQVARLLF